MMDVSKRSKLSGPSRLLAAIALSLGFLAAPTVPAQADSAPLTYCYSQNNQNCVSQWGYTGQSPWGYPIDAYGNNCTNYATFRLNQNGYLNPGNLGNASSWATNARTKGLTVNPGSSRPNVGDVAQWNYGHVAYVEWVSADGSQFAISETGWGPTTLNGVTYASMSGRGIFGGGGRHNEGAWPDNFIHFKGGNGGGVSIGEGSFISYGGNVYRIAGGAPIYVSSWNPFGGDKGAVAVSDAQFNALRAYPADGTFVNGATSGKVYRFAGGAPEYVSSWNSFGGAQPTIAVDDFTLDRPDGGSPLNHVRAFPADGTFISNTADGRVYRVAGGAPLYVSSWDFFGGGQPTTSIDPAEFSYHWHLRAVPADIFLRGLTTGRVFWVTWAGHPMYVGSWTLFGGAKPYLDVDDWAIDHCDHLACSPFGALDSAAGGPGTVTVNGWAVDPNNETSASTIQVSVGGPTGSAGAQLFNVGTETGTRPDITTSLPTVGSAHGFTKTVTTSARGAVSVYVYAVNAAGTLGGNTLLGSKTVTVAALSGQLTATPTPKVSGTATVGHKLTAKAGTWKPTGVSLSYQWTRNGAPISGATNSTYTLVGADHKAKIRVTVTGSKLDFKSVTKTSNATRKVHIGKLHAGTVTMTGTATVGSVLDVEHSGWTIGTGFYYQWYRNSTKIAAAPHGSIYTLTAADVGKRIRVKVTGSQHGYTNASRYTAKTATVK